MIISNRLARTLAVVILCVFESVAASAQTTTATIEGTVTDATGGVISGVTIDVQGETLARSVVSDTAGFYRALALPPGRYTVVATMAGFQSRRLEGIEVALNHTATQHVRMEVAARLRRSSSARRAPGSTRRRRPV